MKFIRGIKNIASWMAGGRSIRQQVSYIRSDLAQLKTNKEGFQTILNPDERQVDEWETFVKANQLTEEAIKKNYANRQKLAGIILLMLWIIVVSAVFKGAFLVGAVSATLLFLLYFQQAFRLYQIRVKQFVPISTYLRVGIKQFSELLPLSLDYHWRLVDEEKTGDDD